MSLHALSYSQHGNLSIVQDQSHGSYFERYSSNAVGHVKASDYIRFLIICSGFLNNLRMCPQDDGSGPIPLCTPSAGNFLETTGEC